MRYIPLITIIVLQTNIAYTQSAYAAYTQPSSGLDSASEFFSAVARQFHLIEELRYREKNTTQLKEAVDSVPRLISTWKATIMNLKDTLDFNLLTIVKSEDSAFCIVSWDTRLGDSKTDYASVVLYKKNNSVYTRQQTQEFIKGKPENPKIKYTRIYTIKAKDKKIYLAKGYGQGRNTEPWQEIKSFCTEDSSLLQPNILPGKKNRVFVAINGMQLKGAKKIPPLSYDSTTLRLTVPVTDRDNIFTGSYISYHFNSKKFKEIKDMDVRYAIAPY